MSCRLCRWSPRRTWCSRPTRYRRTGRTTLGCYEGGANEISHFVRNGETPRARERAYHPDEGAEVVVVADVVVFVVVPPPGVVVLLFDVVTLEPDPESGLTVHEPVPSAVAHSSAYPFA